MMMMEPAQPLIIFCLYVVLYDESSHNTLSDLNGTQINVVYVSGHIMVGTYLQLTILQHSNDRYGLRR